MKRLALFVGALGLAIAAQADSIVRYKMEDGTTIDALPQALVKYKPGRAGAAKSRMFRTLNVAGATENRAINRDKINVPPGKTLEQFIAELKNDPDIADVEPNGIWRATDIPNDPQYLNNQYYLQPNYTDVQGAWDITTGSTTVIVAVIDTGVTLDHEDISTTTSLWNNPAPSGNSGLHGTRIAIDFNGDGDFTDIVSGVGSEQTASNDPTDNNAGTFHGTRVTGLIAAVTNNGTGIASVSRNCRVMAVKALNSSGYTSFEAVAEGIRYAVDNGASIINMSLGGSGTSTSVEDEIENARLNNVVVVAASGNDGNNQPVNFPAAIATVIAVGATDSNNALASFSCTGPELDVVAPGVSILSTIPTDTYGSGNGTSFATPIVSGVVALMRSLQPALSIADVKKYIYNTATDLGTSGFDNAFGYGLINARRALLAMQSQTVFTANPADKVETHPFPNPFRPLADGSTMISIPVSFGVTVNQLEIKIYTQAGELVRTLTNTQTWDGKNDNGSRVASGLYYYFLKTAGGDAKGKITVIQ